MPDAFSYSGDPSTSDRDAVRFLIGDTDSRDPQLSNSEIEFLIANEGTALDAAICAALAIAARYSRLIDVSGEKNSKAASVLAEHYRSLANDLRLKRGRKIVAPYAGGLSVAEKETNAADADIPRPAFRRDLFDNRRELSDDGT